MFTKLTTQINHEIQDCTWNIPNLRVQEPNLSEFMGMWGIVHDSGVKYGVNVVTQCTETICAIVCMTVERGVIWKILYVKDVGQLPEQYTKAVYEIMSLLRIRHEYPIDRLP